MIDQKDLHYETESTRHRDYILMPYEPVESTVGKLHNQTLFWHIVRTLGWAEFIVPICSRLREFLGEDETVWGVKYGPNGCSIEFYFYNFNENSESNLSQVTRINQALDGLLSIPGKVFEEVGYFMCSFELVMSANMSCG